ncbi:MAG: hypothetical protein M3N30_03050 [Bacteroidota bacterium]|nr:hypothetical protein [Bacteroidota bacterium]
MSQIGYYYKSEYQIANFAEIAGGDHTKRFVVTLKNGKQAFLRNTYSSADLSDNSWIQEHYTEHEVWPAELVKALGEAYQSYAQK